MCVCDNSTQLETWKQCSGFNINEKSFAIEQNSRDMVILNGTTQ